MAIRHYVPAMLLSTTLCAGCGKPYDGYFSRLIADGRFGDASQRLLPIARRLAARRYHNFERQDKFVFSYLEGYESGLKFKRGMILSGRTRSTHNQGLQAGRAAALAEWRAGRPRATLENFGYVRMTVTGLMRLGFEMSEFAPDKSRQRWWLYLPDDVDDRYSRLCGPRLGLKIPCVRIHIDGLLAPDRQMGVGHMNMYDREFVVTKVLEIGPVLDEETTTQPARLQGRTSPDGA